MLTKFSTLNTPDYLLGKIQDNVKQAIDPISTNPILDSNLLQNVVLLSGDNTINHKLGRNLIGWIPTRVRASATFFDKQDSNQIPSKTLVINASASVTVDLYVF